MLFFKELSLSYNQLDKAFAYFGKHTISLVLVSFFLIPSFVPFYTRRY